MERSSCCVFCGLALWLVKKQYNQQSQIILSNLTVEWQMAGFIWQNSAYNVCHRDVEAILQQMEDNQSQSYDESRIESLRREVEVSKSELIKLAYDEERLQEKIDELNRRGCQCIAQQLFYQAIVYLNEAESVLEYVAGCGRTIDRTLIIATLHNQACVYQRIWQLNKSSDYLQAIIYNISSFLNSEADAPFTPEIVSSLSTQHHKLAAYLSSKLQLISYNLQFCAVSSQIKNHDNALKAAQKSLNWLKGYCEELHSYEKLLGGRNISELEKNLLLELQTIRNFQNEDSSQMEKNIQKLMYKAKKSISSFQKKAEGASVGLGKEAQRELQNFSLGQVMQVSPISITRLQEKLNLNEQISLVCKIYKAIFMSIAHFTMATQLRLIASQKHGSQSTYRKASNQFKQSQIHHLIAVITVALYVPCYTKYFQHILNSFKNHYQIDLTQMSQLSHNDSNAFGDDLIHLQIQSISARDSELNGHKDVNNTAKYTRVSDKMGISFQNQGHKTVQDINNTGSPESSENQYLKQLNRTAKSTEKKDKKHKPEKSKKKVGEMTSRQKQTLIVEKITSRSKSKGKQLESKRSKSRKSVHQVQQKQRVVHYFHYDNYSKKVVKKKMKVAKDVGEYEITKKPVKPTRDKKSPQVLINQHLKKLNQLSLSTKDLINNQMPKMVKKGKSPQLSTSRSQRLLLKKAS